MTEAFLADIVRTLQPGGRLHFWTDVKEYFDNTLELIAKSTPLVGPIDVPEKSAEHDLDFRTHFERRMRMNGEPVYRSEFVKTPS
jgi:tRNA (guanine-N7-)-methyltransferase